jgi:hypothetical protein
MAPLLFAKYGPLMCNWTEPGVPFASGWPACEIRSAGGALRGHEGTIIRVETSELQYGPWSGGSKVPLTAATIPPAMPCGNFLCPDLIDPERMAGFAWSFAPGEPTTRPDGNTMCIFAALTGGNSSSMSRADDPDADGADGADGADAPAVRWLAAPCVSARTRACANREPVGAGPAVRSARSVRGVITKVDDKTGPVPATSASTAAAATTRGWQLVPADTACPAGTVFAFPRSPYENAGLAHAMAQAAATDPVLINFSVAN